MPQSCKHQRNIQYFFCIVRNVGITNVLETLWYSFEAITLSPTQTLLLLQKACQCDWGDPQSIPQLQRCEQSGIASRPTKNLVPWPRRTPPTPESLLELLPEPHSASGVPQENQASITDLRPGLFECHLHLWTRCLLWTNCDLSREHNREQAVPPSHAPPSLTVHAHVNISSTTEIPGGALRHTKKTSYSEMSLSK